MHGKLRVSMQWFEAIVLGVIQGATEFIPISSSGHLVIVRDIFGFASSNGLAFDAILHFATALAVIVYFRRTWLDILRATWRYFAHKDHTQDGRIGLAIVFGTIPAAVIGVLYADLFETLFRSTTSVAIMLILGSIALIGAEYMLRRNTAPKEISVKRGAIVGLFQVIALMPGISRSGITMAGGMFSGFDRVTATRFSFLLSLPVVLGAGILGFVKMGAVSPDMLLSIILGGVSAFGVGLLAIHGLIKFVRTHSFNIFIYYRIILAVLLLIFF